VQCNNDTIKIPRMRWAHIYSCSRDIQVEIGLPFLYVASVLAYNSKVELVDLTLSVSKGGGG
jgi:hypothetical protein